jgi:hypothetical protein
VRRILFSLFVLALLLSLTGCGAKSATNSDSTNSSSTNTSNSSSSTIPSNEVAIPFTNIIGVPDTSRIDNNIDNTLSNSNTQIANGTGTDDSWRDAVTNILVINGNDGKQYIILTTKYDDPKAATSSDEASQDSSIASTAAQSIKSAVNSVYSAGTIVCLYNNGKPMEQGPYDSGNVYTQ